MSFTWPSSVGFFIAIVVAILLLLLMILHALTVPILAWCVLALAVAIIFR